MKRDDLRPGFSSYTLKRERVKSGRDLIRVSALTRSELENLRKLFPQIHSFDELLYLVARAAIKDLRREAKLEELEDTDR